MAEGQEEAAVEVEDVMVMVKQGQGASLHLHLAQCTNLAPITKQIVMNRQHSNAEKLFCYAPDFILSSDAGVY